MAQYSTGTVSVVSGSAVVTGVGTLWLANLTAGDEIFINSEVVPSTILSVDTDLQITLTANRPATLNNVDYVAISDFTTNMNLPLLNQGDLHAADIYSEAMRAIDISAVALLVDEMYYLDGGLTVTGFKFTRTPSAAIIFYIDGEEVGRFEPA